MPDGPDGPWAAEQDIVVAVAPTLGRALSGPLAGFAFDAVRRALGLGRSDTQTRVAGVLRTVSFEQLQALHQADMRFRAQMKNLRIDPRRLDDASASDPADPFAHGIRFAEIFAVIICVMFFTLLSIFAWHPIPEGANATVLNVMVGAVATSFAGVVGYYFGTSVSSRRKDLLLYNSTATNSLMPAANQTRPDQP